MAHLSLDIKNAQIATFIPDWNKVNEELASGLMDEDEYQVWLEDTLKLFNVPIDDYVYSLKAPEKTLGSLDFTVLFTIIR